jgi:hypothetical protein
MIQFPFWLVTPSPPADAEQSPVAFSSVERMADFLSARVGGQWSVELVNRYSVKEVLAELRDKGMANIRYDAGSNGHCGVDVPLDEIVASAKKAK